MRRAVDVVGRIPLHPPLVAALPVLVLWALNRGEVVPDDAVAMLWPVVAGAVVATGVFSLLLRSLRRGGLVASAGALLALTYGYLGGNSLLPLTGLLVAAGVLVWVGISVARASTTTTAVFTALVNVLAVVGVAVAAVPIAGAGDAGGPTRAGGVDLGVDVPDPQDLPDIVYVVPDRYGAVGSLQEHLGVDATGFVDFLDQHGFAVADDATANYPTTSLSLASTLRMDYLDDVAAAVPDDALADIGPLRELLQDHRLGEILTSVGYEYVHIGSWWGPTATAVDADRVLNWTNASEFAEAFRVGTALPAVQSLVGDDEPASTTERRYANNVWQLDQLERLVTDAGDRPRFVLAHLTLPHEPYVLDEDGSYVPEEVTATRSRSEAYRRQLAYLNLRLRDIVTTATAQPDGSEPVLVIQADEGPHPERKELVEGASFDWWTASDEELETKFRILSAVRLPGGSAPDLLPEDVSAVNTWRIVLNEVLGTEFELLEDRLRVHHDDQDYYTFLDVTDRVRDGAGGAG